jgi:ABC-type sugar transport system permease subunit
VGLANYRDAFVDPRFHSATTHTVLFVIVSVTLELVTGLVLAMVMRHATRGRAALRVLVLLPWAIPTAASALIWRFLFDSQAGLVNEVLVAAHVLDAPRVWLVDPTLAWIPIIAADVWKTTPFVALLLLAGLQNIDDALYDAAQIDGAGPWREFVEITLPLLRPAIVVALAFRALDAFRVFDLIYVLTGGGPGTATESVSLYTFSTLLQKLRFGYASALSVIVFSATFGLGLIYVRAAGRHLLRVD